MDNTVIGAGLALLIAAILGGGIEAFSIKIPIIKTTSARLILLTLGVVMIAGSVIYKIPAKNNEDNITHKILHRNYMVGWSLNVVGDNESDNIGYHLIDQKVKYDDNTLGIAYSNNGKPGFMIFNIRNKKIIGYWKDRDNEKSPLPGRIELEFNDDATFAKGWWSWDPRSDASNTKYHAYMKQIP